MSGLVKKINGIPNLHHGQGCVTSQIVEAQKKLGLEFPEEYIDYVKAFGVISFYGTEWTGLNVEERLSVVEATLQERRLNDDFPADCFLLENLGIDGIVAAANGKGEVFLVQYKTKKRLCGTLGEYLDLCIARKNKP